MCTQNPRIYQALRCIVVPAAIYLLSATLAVAQNIADFALGGHNICLIDTEGNLECTTRFEEEVYLPPDDGTLYSSVSSGDAHSCAITQGGELRCWGMNNFGQLDAPTLAVDFVSVASSEGHSCAIDANMQAHCWGLNTNGQTAVPEPNAGFVSLELGAIASCGSKESGETVCWSSAEGITANIPDNPAYSNLAVAGFGQACGLTQEGFIDCWATTAFSVDAPAAGPYTQIDLNTVFFCGLTSAGLLDCNVREFTPATSFNERNSTLLNQVASLPLLTSFEVSRQTFPGTSICGVTLDGDLACIGEGLPANALPGTQTSPLSDIPQLDNLRFTAYSDTTIELFWDNNNNSFAGINIYRDNELLAFTSNLSSYLDDTLVVDQDFVYAVALVDAAGFEGPMSESILVSTGDRGLDDTGNNVNASLSHPGQPTNISITRYGDTSLEIFWDRPSGIFNPSFQVYRNGEFLAFAPGPSYFDDSVNPDTAYSYTIVVVEFRGDDVIGVGFANEPVLNAE